MVNSPLVPVDKQPKDLHPHNATGVVQNTLEGKRKRNPPTYVIIGSVQSYTSSLEVPSPLAKKKYTPQSIQHEFIQRLLCGRWMLLVFLFMATIPVILFIKSDRGRKTKLWNIKYDNDEEECQPAEELVAGCNSKPL